MTSPADAPIRNDSEKLCLVVNPRAGAGKAQRGLEDLRRDADRHFRQWEILLTEGPGHATELARAASGQGYDLVAAVGGDGTCNEVVNGLMEATAPGPVFAVVPLGTGSDLIKSLGVPRSTAEALAVAASGTTAVADVARASLLDSQDRPLTRYFFNVAGFGSNGEVVARANRTSKRLGGTLTFLRATVETVLTYRPQRLALEWWGPQGHGQWEGEVQAAFLANGHYCGGGMWVGRGGSLQDGLLDLCIAPPMSFLTSTRHLVNLYRGTLDQTPGVILKKICHLRAIPLQPHGPPVLIDLDGEQPGKLAFDVHCLQGALRARGRWLDSEAR